MSGEHKVYGLVLCLAAGHRLAFPADQVIAVESWATGEGFPHARVAYDVKPEYGRALLAESGEAVAVDAVEMMQEVVSVMPTPVLLRKRLGGSLAGFATAKDALWPVLDVVAFSRYLSSLQTGASV